MAITDATDGEIVARYLRKGVIVQIPVKDAPRVLVLEWLVKRVPLNQTFSETDINGHLSGHEVDYATLRRLLVDNGLLAREKGVYWRVEKPPASAQDVPGVTS